MYRSLKEKKITIPIVLLGYLIVESNNYFFSFEIDEKQARVTNVRYFVSDLDRTSPARQR